MIRRLAILSASVAILLPSAGASAQDYIGMMNEQHAQFEAQMQGYMVQQNQQFESLLQQAIESDRPRWEAEHKQYVQATGQQISLIDFVRSRITEEAARRNNAASGGVNPMFEQQKRMFENGQRNHFERQNQYDGQLADWNRKQQQIEIGNDAWRRQQGSIDGGVTDFNRGVIREHSLYNNPETGEVAELPHTGDPGIYQGDNGSTYGSQKRGEFYQVGPGGASQPMEPYAPNSNGGWFDE